MLAFALGREVAVDFYECDPAVLNSCEMLRHVCESAAGSAGATVLKSHFHNFTPQGTSGVVVIAESHFAVHAWPEYRFAALDMFTCSEKVDFTVAAEEFASGVRAASHAVRTALCRGEFDNGSLKKFDSIEMGPDHFSATPSWERVYNSLKTPIGMSAEVDLIDCANLQARGVFIDRFGIAGSDVVIRRNPLRGTVNIDMFKNSFFEPRTVAEAALEEFAASRYTLQVNLRQ